MEIESAKCLQKHISAYSKLLRDLPEFTYNKVKLNYSSINTFDLSTKRKNDKNNKIRESIIGAIVNNKLPYGYFEFSRRWNRLVFSLYDYVKSVYDKEEKMKTVKLLHKAGRKYNYDFELVFNSIHVYKIEFKFNASSVKDTPQFVSPMNPSKYLSASYEEMYYTNYLPRLMETLPDKEEYLKSVGSPKPKCLKEVQERYYRGAKASSKFSGVKEDIDFHQKCKDLDKESRRRMIQEADLDIGKLSEYLQKTQEGKIYMLYKNGVFHKEVVEMRNYQIVEAKKNPRYFRYDCETASGKKMKVLLRWKNGNGVAYPAFQIS